jgi:signal transduction histidine kinase
VAVLDRDRRLDDLLERVIGQAAQLLDADGCRLYRLQRDSDELVVAASAGPVPDVALVAAGRALNEDRPLVALGGTIARDLAGAAAGLSGDLLAVPLLVRDHPYGVLALSYARPRSFSRVDVRLLASFGGQVALALENARLRDELQRSAAADERSRIARDLHDSVTQSLFAASLKAEAVRRRWRPDSDEGRRTVEDLERLSRGALAEMRTLLLEMRPGTIAEAPLPALVRQLVEAARGRTRIAVDLEVSGAGQLPPDVVVAFYRIAQEALHNLEHHSGAGRAWVMLDLSDTAVRLEVGDDGSGFETGQVTRDHLGLSIMRETAEAAGVTVGVDSAPDRGTVVTAAWRGDEGGGDD